MEFFLASLNDPVAPQIPVTDEHVLVGRGPECRLRLTNTLVSRRHAEIWAAGDMLYLRDLGSRNGTVVNGEYVGRARELEYGDVVTFATESFVVRSAADGAREREEVESETCPQWQG